MVVRLSKNMALTADVPTSTVRSQGMAHGLGLHADRGASWRPIQYTRCTYQKADSLAVSECIIDNTPKATWLEPITEWEGADRCPDSDSLLTKLGMTLLVQTVVALLTSGKMWKIIRASRKQKPVSHG